MPDTLITTEELEAPPAPTMFRTSPMTEPPHPHHGFPNAETGMTAAAGLLNEDGELITASHTHSLDVIGTITRGGEWDDEGNVITPPETSTVGTSTIKASCLMGGRGLRCIRQIRCGRGLKKQPLSAF
jgi:hypothetical protein